MSWLKIDNVPPPHQGQPIFTTGTAPNKARAVFVMIHGRGASAESILSLAAEFQTGDLAYVAPQAAGHTWYPHRFLAPISNNEPHLSSALALIEATVQELIKLGIAQEKIVLLGFSQGACLAQEYAVRHAGRYGGVIGLSGGLIGPPGTVWENPGHFEETPVFLGCSDIDAHIPVERVDESAAVFERMGAAVTKRIYPGMGHTINQDEINWIKQLAQRL